MPRRDAGLGRVRRPLRLLGEPLRLHGTAAAGSPVGRQSGDGGAVEQPGERGVLHFGRGRYCGPHPSGQRRRASGGRGQRGQGRNSSAGLFGVSREPQAPAGRAPGVFRTRSAHGLGITGRMPCLAAPSHKLPPAARRAQPPPPHAGCVHAGLGGVGRGGPAGSPGRIPGGCSGPPARRGPAGGGDAGGRGPRGGPGRVRDVHARRERRRRVHRPQGERLAQRGAPRGLHHGPDGGPDLGVRAGLPRQAARVLCLDDDGGRRAGGSLSLPPPLFQVRRGCPPPRD